MTTDNGSGGVGLWIIWSVGALSAFGDVSVVALIGGGYVWVEAWLVWGHGDGASIVCTESVIVLALAVATLW